MQIILNGRRVGKRRSNRWIACYEHNRAYFTKEALNKRVILHEFYHHLIDSKNLELPLHIDEIEANSYARKFIYC